jgi:hypothetical protein
MLRTGPRGRVGSAGTGPYTANLGSRRVRLTFTGRSLAPPSFASASVL